MESEQNQQPEQNTEESQTKPTTEQPAQQPQEKKQSRIALLLAVLTLCLIAAGAIYYLNSIEKEVVEPVITSSEKKQDDQTFAFEGLTLTEDEEQSLGVVVYAPTIERYLSLDPVEDYIYAATYESTNDMQYSAEEVVQLFVADAQQDGFTIYTEQNAELAAYLTDNKKVRVIKDSVLCELSAYESEQGVGTVYRMCVYADRIEAEATLLKPFYDAYEASSQYQESDYRGPYYISADEAFVEDSSIAGYQYLYGGVGDFFSGASAAFVREDGGEWVFFKGRQSITSCDEYNSELFQKALADESCQTEEGVQKTVKEYYNL